MECVRLEPATRLEGPTALSLGNFDGVHRGHLALAEAIVRHARELNGRAVVLTFEPHPARVLALERAPLALMTVEQKAEALGELGVNWLVVAPFTASVANQSAEVFATSVLKSALGAALVVIGPGFRFGRGRVGDATDLDRAGLRVAVVPAVLEGGRPVSSTRVRESLERGAVDLARLLLGRPFANDGRVVPGDGRGRLLGVPTANLAPANEVVPANGVYAAWFRVRSPSGRLEAGWPAVVNVGRRPTFGGGQERVEAHLLGFSGDLYDRTARVEYHSRLREERRFADAQELVLQVHSDAARALSLLEKRS
jgi:riboflavin kinase/FMN adenylyltransferase